jgi:hypothetical protein
MKRMLLTLLVLGLVSNLNADEPESLIDAINATSEAREILMKDLQDADLGPTVRSEFSGCPSRKQFAKILEDEKRYNAAARRWFKEMSAP